MLRGSNYTKSEETALMCPCQPEPLSECCSVIRHFLFVSWDVWGRQKKIHTHYKQWDHLKVKVTQCPTLRPQGHTVLGILQARIMEWVVLPFSRGSSQHRDQTYISCDSCIAVEIFTTEPPGKPQLFVYLHVYVSNILLKSKTKTLSISPPRKP